MAVIQNIIHAVIGKNNTDCLYDEDEFIIICTFSGVH